MELRDLTEPYKNYISGSSSLSEYLGSYPDFFEHYLKFWGTEQPSFSKLSLGELEANKQRVLTATKTAVSELNMAGFDLSKLEVVLFVGQNTSNGHAFFKGGKATAFIALESYHSTLYGSVFCAHEMVHALHYQSNPKSFFQSIEEKLSVSRLLLTEGIATYLTQTIFGYSANEALWADYLAVDSLKGWNERFSGQKRELMTHCLVHFDTCDAKAYKELFTLSDIENPFTSRAGYKIGLDLIESIATKENLTPVEILQIDRHRLRKELESQVARVRD